MRIKRTKLVAVFSHTFTTTETFTTTSRTYHAAPSSGGEVSEDEIAAASLTTESSQADEQWCDEWCDECCAPMTMMNPERAAIFSSQSTRAIYRMVEEGRVHFVEGPEGVMVCAASLMRDWSVGHTRPALNP